MDDRYEPATIDVARDEGVTITFVDGHVARYALEDMRRACPCATCRGMRDRGEDAWPRPGSPQPLRVEHARLHGGWGLNIEWNDGHGTGIFPFESLRHWDDGGAPAFPPDSGLGH